MPRKKSTEGKPVNAEGETLKSVRVELTPNVHRKLRIMAASKDTSMAALARHVIEEYVSRFKSDVAE